MRPKSHRSLRRTYRACNVESIPITVCCVAQMLRSMHGVQSLMLSSPAEDRNKRIMRMDQQSQAAAYKGWQQFCWQICCTMLLHASQHLPAQWKKDRKCFCCWRPHEPLEAECKLPELIQHGVHLYLDQLLRHAAYCHVCSGWQANVLAGFGDEQVARLDFGRHPAPDGYRSNVTHTIVLAKADDHGSEPSLQLPWLDLARECVGQSQLLQLPCQLLALALSQIAKLNLWNVVAVAHCKPGWMSLYLEVHVHLQKIDCLGSLLPSSIPMQCRWQVPCPSTFSDPPNVHPCSAPWQAPNRQTYWST